MYKVGDIIASEYAVSLVFTNGGMGVVYKVHRFGWDVDMAMKCPRAELFENDAQCKGFIRECETWMRLGSHPNIVSCYYVKQIDSVPAVFMEYADGGSLLDRIKSGSLYEGTPEEALRRILDYSIQTARGLFHAHQKGYVHQDVKPANVLLTATGLAKVSDFGLSKAKTSTSMSAHIKDGRSLVVSSGGWTPAYGSPEQDLGLPLTRRTDIWSWAVMILGMIHGKIFWKQGPFAARALHQLWPWKVFSPKVKSSHGLVKLLQECLEEREENRPKDFDVVERNLLSLYRDALGEEYPRKLPAVSLMSEATLINRIASYAELESTVGNYFGEVYDCLCELQRVAPWTIWGDLNYVAYLHARGIAIGEIYPVVKNVMLKAHSESDRKWLLNALVSLGVNTPRDLRIDLLRIDEHEQLLNQVLIEHKTLGMQLHELFDGKLRCQAGSGDRHEWNEKRICYSEHRKVSVRAKYLKGSFNDKDLSIVVNTADVSFQRTDGGFPRYSNIGYVTVDDAARRISIWIHVDGRGWYQKVYTLEDGKLIPYRCDFREISKWGFPCSVYISGDAAILMAYYGRGRCSVWLNESGGVEDGRNVCDLNLSDFGLIPPESILPGLKFRTGYEYGMSAEIAYPLMRLLATFYGKRRISCRIIRPESSDVELRRSQEVSALLEVARQSIKIRDNRQMVASVRHCLELGILPSEELMATCHRIVIHENDSHLIGCWHSASIDEYWDEPIESISSYEPDKFQLASFGFRPRILCTRTNEHGLLTGCWPWAFRPRDEFDHTKDSDFFVVAGCENGDIIIGCKPDICPTWLRRMTRNPQGQQQTVWECRLPEVGTGIEFFSSLQQTNSTIAFSGDLSHVVVVQKATGEMTVRSFDEGIDYWQADFERDAPLVFLVVTPKRIVALDRGDAELRADAPICRFARRYELQSVSTNGCVAVGNDCWGRIHVCDLKTGNIRALYEGSPFDNRYSPCLGMRRAIISRTGRVVAIETHDGNLRVYDVRAVRLIFRWVITGEMKFDLSERWLAVVHERKKMDVFQLFWDSPRGEKP